MNLSSTSIYAQDLASCSEPYVIDLSIGYDPGGFGRKECGCSPEVNDCELINIILRRTINGVSENLNCDNISLTERWWREEEDYVDIYNPITCEEYPESETHRDRYEFNTSHLAGGDTLQILICKTDPYNDNLIELRAYPGEDCMESKCPPELDCPASFKLRKNQDCDYELPDFTTGITLTDVCQSPGMVVSEEYFILQSPAAGTLITDSLFVTITVQDQENITVGTCDIYVTLAGNPAPEMDDPDPIADIIHGDHMPDFQLILAHDTMYDNSVIQVAVSTTIDEFISNPCEGYQVTYRWSATDACDNTTSKVRTFDVLPDVNDPIFASVPIDIDTIPSDEPLPILVDLVAVNGDGTIDGITMDKSIDPYEENICQGYPVTYRWSATDQCNNSSELVKTFYVKAVNTPPLFLEAVAPIADITYRDPMPTVQEIQAMSADGDTSNVTVTHFIEPHIENSCESYEVKYVWEARDLCDNIATISTSFSVHPALIDFTDMFSMEDISLSLGSNCEKEAVLGIPLIPEEYGNVGLIYSVHDDQWKMLESFEGGEESSYAFTAGVSYVVYSIIHECGTTFHDTITVQAEDLNAPFIECQNNITLYASGSASCLALAKWTTPEAIDNCGSATLQQLSGPNQGDSISTGLYDLQYIAIDNFGNSDTCSFQLEVLPFSVDEFNCESISIDIDESCDAWITLDTLIDRNTFHCASNLEAAIVVNNDTLRSPRINLNEYRDQRIQYLLCDPASGICCGNSIQIKDRLAPVITCADDVYVSCIFAAETYRPAVAAECGSVDWQYTEQATIETCDNDSVKAILNRTFYAIDDQGNVSEPCVQKIHVLYAQLNEQLSSGNISFPPDTSITCNNYNSNNTTTDFTGTPMVGNMPLNIGKNNDCGIITSYSDNLVASYGCTKVVHRKWTLTEPICQSTVNIETFTQIIKVIDQSPPEVRLSKKEYHLAAATQTCQAEFQMPALAGVDNCDSELEFSFLHNGYWYEDYFPSLTLAAGPNKILIRAADDCNNYGFDTITVHVHDPIMPVAICFENTNVAIPASGTFIHASDLDAGSYDNCAIEKLEIKRGITTCTIEDSYFKDRVSFCCEDIGNTVKVYLKVTDKSGNTNICTGTINIVDKTAPTISIPPSLKVDCKMGITKENDTDPYKTMFGKPSIWSNDQINIPVEYILQASGPLFTGQAKDNCSDGLLVNVITEDNTNDCGIGIIKRSFVAIDKYGNRSEVKEQTIEVVGGFTLDTNLIVWPQLDTTIVECTSIRDINPDILGRPYIQEAPCVLYGISHEDVYYSLSGDADGACSKMTRQWSVINWCDIDANMYASRTQIIKLVDQEAPQLESNDMEIEVYGTGLDCNRITVNLQKRGSDNCTSDDHLIWSLIANKNSDDEAAHENILIDSNGIANASLELAIGYHTITWIVQDQCGNQSTAIQNIYVDNDKAPTPYATGLTTAISSSREVEIRASDLLAKAEHPCYDDLEISIARVNDPYEASSDAILFTCNDIGTNFIKVYASRILSNGRTTYDYTTVKVEIQDNFNFCDHSDSNQVGSNDVTGSVITSYGVILPDAEVILKDMLTSDIEQTVSDNTGSYSFPIIQAERPYFINAEYEDILNNGLTTRDVILIQQHLMGINSFDSHWQMMQSDVNQDLRVSAIDIVELRKTIIGLKSEMDQFSPWKFYDAKLSFDPQDQVAFQSAEHGVHLENLLPGTKENLIGLKMGDIDHSAELSQDGAKSRTLEIQNLLIKNAFIESGEIKEIEIFIDDAIGLGWQFELIHDDQIEIIDVSNNYNNAGLTIVGGNRVRSTISQASPWKINTTTPIFVVKVKALKDVFLKESLRLRTTSVKPEFYNASLNIIQLALNYIEDTQDLDLSEPYPNPFRANSEISISLHKSQSIQMKITDATGSIINDKTLKLNSGVNYIDFKRSDLPNAGLYFVHLNIGENIFIRRLILTP